MALRTRLAAGVPLSRSAGLGVRSDNCRHPRAGGRATAPPSWTHVQLERGLDPLRHALPAEFAESPARGRPRPTAAPAPDRPAPPRAHRRARRCRRAAPPARSRHRPRLCGSSPTSLATTARAIDIARCTTPLCDPATYGVATTRVRANSALRSAIGTYRSTSVTRSPCALCPPPHRVGIGVGRGHARDRQPRRLPSRRPPGRRRPSARGCPWRAATRRRTGSSPPPPAQAARPRAAASRRGGSRRPGGRATCRGTGRGSPPRARRPRRLARRTRATVQGGPATARTDRRRRAGCVGAARGRSRATIGPRGTRVSASAPAAAGATLRSSTSTTPSYRPRTTTASVRSEADTTRSAIAARRIR